MGSLKSHACRLLLVDTGLEVLRHDPIPPLLGSGKAELTFFCRRDLLGEGTAAVATLWSLPEVRSLMVKQHADGSWGPSEGKGPVFPPYRHRLVETWKALEHLSSRFGATLELPGVREACEFILFCQSGEGDIRGFAANQYATYYVGAVLATLIRAGYAGDARVKKGLEWLLSVRQDDGGWSIPHLTLDLTGAQRRALLSGDAAPVAPDRTKPFSHNWTDMALRAFAAHPTYRRHPGALRAAELLKSSFFKPDFYPSLRDSRYWVRFLFWWPNLLTALETLSAMGFRSSDPDIATAQDWFVHAQGSDGLWRTSYWKERDSSPERLEKERRLWLTLRICRVLRSLR